MAYNFLGLVNDVNRRLNEVELTSANFSTAIGFYAHAKDAVNWAIQNLNQTEFEWPFNHVTETQVLVAGTNRYSFPSDKKTVNFETFRVERDDALGNRTSSLRRLDYEEYLQKYSDDEYNTSNTSIRGLPKYVFRTPDFQYGVYPVPDKAYSLTYEYYQLPTALVDYDDVPTVPEQFRNIINEGAMSQAYLFRGNTEASEIATRNFMQGVKNMRGIMTNRYDYARSTMRA